jgi:hypothetical protein
LTTLSAIDENYLMGSVQRPFLTFSYLAAHLAAASACFGVVFFGPLLFMLGTALRSGDPGGPLFWPLFLPLLVAAGLGVSFVCSALVLLVDFIRLRRRVPVWIPSGAAFAAGCLVFARSGQWKICLLVGVICCLGFSLYWLAVSSAWFLPRLLFRVLRSCIRTD